MRPGKLTQCRRCGAAIVYLENLDHPATGLLAVDTTPSQDGTLMVGPDHGVVHVRTATIGYDGPRYTRHEPCGGLR